MRRELLLACLLLASASACNGPVAAGRDFLDPWRFVVGASSGVGVRARAAGLLQTGVLMGVKPHASALGIKYGEVYAFQLDAKGYEADPTFVYFTDSTFDGDFGAGSYKLVQRSYALFPAFTTWVDSAPLDEVRWRAPEEGNEMDGMNYIWSAEALREQRFAAIHSFDVGAEVSLFLYVDVGFSPGELVDFFVGALTGLDIAKDDGRPR